jgi:8-oxo-dGTP pyrophosphatase MutT (NUDIX family)
MEIETRDAIRVVIVDAADRVLLFHTQDPTYPELGTWWELPGGGVEPGESPRETAIREVAEEADIDLSAAPISPPSWRRSATYRYRGVRRISNELVVAARLDRPGPAVDGSGRVDFEDEDYFDFRWWPIADIRASTERFYPGRLPEVLESFLAGEPIDEPMEEWS